AHTSTKTLVCIHPVGGQIHHYRHLSDVVGATRNVYGIRSRAILDHAREYVTVNEMATAYADIIRSLNAKHLVLLGYSSGGILAMAVANMIEQLGGTVNCVCLLDSYWLEDVQVQIERESLHAVLQTLRETFQHQIHPFKNAVDEILGRTEFLQDDLLLLSDEERFEHVSRLLAEFNLPHQVLEATLRNQSALYRRHYQMLKGFKPQKVNARMIIGWAGETLPGVSALEHSNWADYARRGATVRTFNANHYSIVQPPAVQHVADALLPALEGNEHNGEAQ
ncbi:MAG: alpha/beta fold hydrolase, partial [Bacteroidota bacterium]